MAYQPRTHCGAPSYVRFGASSATIRRAARTCSSTERRGPLTDSAVRKIVARAGIAAGLTFPVHPHMLRHACGYKLANDGQDTRAIQQYLGHRNISHTVRYTELAPQRFRNFWQD